MSSNNWQLLIIIIYCLLAKGIKISFFKLGHVSFATADHENKYTKFTKENYLLPKVLTLAESKKFSQCYL